MHYTKSYLIIALMGLLFFSCKKEDTPDKPAAASMSATVDGQPWAPDTWSAEYRDGRLLLVAQAVDGSRFGLTAVVSAPGTLDLSASSAIILYDRNDGNPIFLSWIVSNNTGSVTITELDLEGGTVSGKFSCKMKQPPPNTGLAEINEVTFENIPLSGLLPSELIFSATVGAPGIYNPFFPSAYVSTVTGNIEISSAEEDGISGVVFILSKNTNPGTYTIKSFLTNSTPAGGYVKSTALYDGMGGTLTISSHDKINRRIKGTFAFNGVKFGTNEVLAVSDGNFDVNY